jgi:uncharacterized protein (DUF1800 family)
MTVDAVTALTRFGLGPRPGDLAGIAADPRAALIADIADRDAAVIAADLPTTAEAMIQLRDYRQQRNANRLAVAGMSGVEPARTAAPTPGELMSKEAAARLRAIGNAEIGFAERLAQFWANHFAVEVDDGQLTRGTAGAYEREAIRPHVLGKFSDMLLAVARHPTMLTYLDNAVSVGPNSQQGMNRAAGLNENFGRELLELHTLGVNGGYSQADVTALATILTGWGFGQNAGDDERFGKFTFRAQAHEPGPQTVLGRVYDQRGVNQGEAALADLALHPATASHIATKLVRHFVADAPPAELVAALAQVFTDTGGDLQAVSRALVEADAAWAAPVVKLRAPQDYLWAGIRALGLKARPQLINRALVTLGQPLWNPPAPNGFNDLSATWLAPDAMSNRIDIAQLMAQEAGDGVDPRGLAEAVLGPRLTAATRDSISRAESPSQGVVLMLMSPEFQRR